jgi:hypothetical protein
MPKFWTHITNFFVKKVEGTAPGDIPEDLIRVNDWDGLYNYFTGVINYYYSIQSSIEGFDKSLNKPNWVVEMCLDLHSKVNQFRTYHAKTSIPLSVIYDKEELATTQKDYSLKLALYCTDLCVK